METSITAQTVQLALCLLMGLASGLIYDAFRALRRETTWRVLPALLDTVFSAAVCFSLFVIGMSAGEGSLSITTLMFVFAGFVLYMLLFSNVILHFFRRLVQLLKKLLSPFKKIFSAVSEATKSALQKAVYWLKKKRRKNGGEPSEKTQSARACSHRDYGDADLWRGESLYDGASPSKNGKAKQ